MSADIKNLSSAIQNLQKEFVAIRESIQNLQNQLTTIKNNQSTQSSEFTNIIDHATLQQSIVDDLLKVNQYATSRDGETSYVLPSLNIQLKTFITTNKDGKPVYALPARPGEFDPNLLSTVTLPFAAIPLPSNALKKQSQAPSQPPQPTITAVTKPQATKTTVTQNKISQKTVQKKPAKNA